MTSDDLNQLFASAREIPVETAPEHVAGWIGTAAATSTGVLGIAGKLKLLIAKKTFIIMGTILSVAGLGLIVTMSLNSSEKPAEAVSKKESTTVVSVESKPKSKTERKEVQPAVLDNKVPKVVEVEEVIKPIAPIVAELPEIVFTPPAPQQRTINSDRREVRKKNIAPNADREFIVDDFTVLKISGLVDVVLIQGSTSKVTFDIDPAMQEEFQLNTVNGVLNISFGEEAFANKRNNVVYVTFKDLEELRFSGVGNVSTQGKIKLNDLLCKVSGVGDISLNLDCKNLDVKFSGVGNVKVEGSGDAANYAWSGVGDLNANDMKTKNVALSLSGMGDAQLHATEALEVNLTGFGDVKYSGSPKTTDLNAPGIGDIKGS
jgi:hypothetical protein